MGVCAILLHSVQAFAPPWAPCRLSRVQTRAQCRPLPVVMMADSPPLFGLLGGLFQLGGGGKGWAGPLGVRRAELKSQLAQAVELNQGREARQRVEGILEELIALQGPIEPRSKLLGDWRLIWSSQTADAFPFAKPSVVLGGDCIQRISGEAQSGLTKQPAILRVENLVIWPFLGGLTLNGGASLEALDATRSILRIDDFALELGSRSLPLLELTQVAPISVRDAPVVKAGSQLVTVSNDKTRVLNAREGFLDLLYFDEEGLRVTQSGDTGLLYIHLLQGSSLI